MGTNQFSMRRFSLLFRNDLLFSWKWFVMIFLIEIGIILMIVFIPSSNPQRNFLGIFEIQFLPILFLIRSLFRKYWQTNLLPLSLLLPASKLEKFSALLTITLIFSILNYGFLYAIGCLLNCDLMILKSTFFYAMELTILFFCLLLIKNLVIQILLAILLFVIFQIFILPLESFELTLIYVCSFNLLFLFSAWKLFCNYNMMKYVKKC